MRDETTWLNVTRSQILRGDLASAQATLAQALSEHPDSLELRRVQAGAWQRAGAMDKAEAALRDLLVCVPGDAATAFALARILKMRDCTAATAAVLRGCMASASLRTDIDLAIASIELLADCARQHDALAIADGTIASGAADPRLHAYAGMLAVQLGEFDKARGHYLFALDHDERAIEWHVPIGLASTLRYAEQDHPDLARFRAGLERADASALARAELHFAIGKAFDDCGDYAQTAAHLRDGNAIRKSLANWSRKSWRRLVSARLASRLPSMAATTTPGFTPIFIVGMPRSGTTLLAELLAQRPGTCNRGELPLLAQLAQSPQFADRPDQADLLDAAAQYARGARQDDAAQAQWFIDKQPLNFRYVDLALSMFPDAKVIHCQRDPRDTALSLWMQCFLEDVQAYSYDFADIEVVMRDCRRLMEHWHSRFPESIRCVRYEALVASPQSVIAELAAWIGLPASPADAGDAPQPVNAINTASLWQARQPVHANSVERWRRYAPYIPELATLSDS